LYLSVFSLVVALCAGAQVMPLKALLEQLVRAAFDRTQRFFELAGADEADDISLDVFLDVHAHNTWLLPLAIFDSEDDGASDNDGDEDFVVVDEAANDGDDTHNVDYGDDAAAFQVGVITLSRFC
jgi:hypothetical protein